ncbi:MAG: S8 family serine peptidase, partial [Candidatus Hydrogenedentes bacterium]|nr:S8 family serine peptidase [Candidatus Hydrogenedentota bacterium]
QIRFVRPGDATFRTAETEAFQVWNGGQYYVNDSSVVNDMYCNVTGQTYNGTTVTGQTPNDPVSSIAAILTNYTLHPGDTIHVDTGSYTLASDLVFDAADSGTSSKPVTIKGSTNGTGTVVTHGNRAASTACLYANGVLFLTIENLKVTGARNGILLLNCFGCTVRNNECYSNGVNGGAGLTGAGAGIYVAGEGLNAVKNNVCRNNGAFGGNGSGSMNGGPGRGWGLVVSSSQFNTVRGNTCYSNGGLGGHAGSATYFPGYSEGAGIFVETSEPTVPADGNHILDNTCHNNDVTGAYETSNQAAGGLARSYGIALLETTNSTVERNTVYDNDALGGPSWYNDGGSGFARGIYGQGETDLTVLKNISYENYGQGAWSGIGSEDAIGVGRGAGLELFDCSQSILMNNLAYGNFAGVYDQYLNEQQGEAQGFGALLVQSSDCQVYNNTLLENFAFVNLGEPGIVRASQAYIGATSSACEVKNNILESIPHNQPIFCLWVESTSQTGFSSDYNVLFNNIDTGWAGVWGANGWRYFADWKTGSGQDGHSLNTDPLFYDAALDNYHLAYNSPTIDLGENLASVQLDGDGETRPADGPDADLVETHDIGYDEFIDTDADELADWIETNVTGTGESSWDTDGDGMHDGWELRYGLDPNSAVGNNGANGDPDGDGYTNIQEYPGYNPNDPAIYPSMPPIITEAVPREASVSLIEEQSLAFSVVATDIDGDPLSYSWKLDGAEQGTGASWTYFPSDTASGAHNVRVDVTAAGDTTTREWDVTVLNRNHAPQLDPASLPNVTASIGDTVTLAPSYSDPDNLNAVANDDNTHTVSYTGWMATPSKTLVPGDGGIHTVTVTVTDNGAPPLSDSHVVTITVTGEPDIEIQPNRVDFRSSTQGGWAKTAATALIGENRVLDLRDAGANLGAVLPDEIVVRFTNKVAAGLHADWLAAGGEKQSWLDHSVAFEKAPLPPAVRGLLPYVSGQAKARSILEKLPSHADDVKTVQQGDPLPPGRKAQVAASLNAAAKETDAVGVFYARLAPGTDLRAVCGALMARDDVLYAHPSPVYAPNEAPNDPLFNQMWNLGLTTVDDAWDVSGNTPGNVTVCVVDTGVRITHSELEGRVSAPKDVYPNNGDAFADSNPDNDDPLGHGTACAGIIAARRGNNTLMAGIAPVNIIPVNGAIYSSGQWMITHYEDGIYWGVDHGADVISLSFGGYRSAPYSSEVDAAEYAAAHGVLVCAAAGNANNEGTEGGVPRIADNHYPSAISTYVAVSGVDDTGYRVSPSRWGWGSNYGSSIDLCAPCQAYLGPDGDSVITLWAASNDAYINDFAGTSAAAPHVAGIAALVKHVNPFLSATEIREALENTARDQVGDPTEDTPGRDDYHGYGLVDALAAVNNASGGTTPQTITIQNQGDTDLTVTGIEKEQNVCWLTATPAAPLPAVIPGHGSLEVSLAVDLSCTTPGNYSERLLVSSNDPDENPYPDGVYVYLVYSNPEPVLTSDPADRTVYIGDSAEFTVSATGEGTLSYQWKKDGAPISDDARISGSTTTTLSIAGVILSDAGDFSCVVSNAWASVESDLAVLTVLDPPPPASPTVTGTTPTNDSTPTWSWLSGGGTGSGSFRYQLGSEGGAWTATTAVTFTPAAPLAEGGHTLYVQEANVVGEWSDSGSFLIDLDLTAPGPPSVSGSTPTQDL